MSALRPRSSIETRCATRRALVAAASLLGVLAGGAAAAQSALPLRWSGPQGCPTEAEVRAEVERLTAGSTEPARLVEVAAHVARDAGGYRVRVETTLRDGRAARDLAAPTCRELADATATIVALMIDPASAERATSPACVGCTPEASAAAAAGASARAGTAGTAGGAGAVGAAGAVGSAGAVGAAAGARAAEANISLANGAGASAAGPGTAPANASGRGAAASATAPTRRGAPPGRAAPPPVTTAAAAPGARVDPRTGRPASARSGGPATAGAPGTLGAPADGRDATATEVGASPSGPERWSLGARAVGDVGTLPEPALGVAIAGGVALGRLRLELAGGWYPGSEVILDGYDRAGGELSLFVVDATGCYRFRQLPPSLDLCGGVELDHMRGQGVAVSEKTTSGAWWASALGGGRMSVPVVDWLSLDAELGAALALGRPKFELQGMGELHRPSVVAGRGAAGASLHFR